MRGLQGSFFSYRLASAEAAIRDYRPGDAIPDKPVCRGHPVCPWSDSDRGWGASYAESFPEPESMKRSMAASDASSEPGIGVGSPSIGARPILRAL